MSNRFAGKVALVTGAGSPRGIGRATALALAREGAKVTVTDIVAENVQRVAAELNEISQGLGEVADVRNKQQMAQVVRKTVETLGGLDILVNNAGLTRPTQFLDISEEEYDLVLDVNLKGTFLTTQAAVPAMLQRGGGVIVSLSSVSGERGGGVFGTTAYSASKAGIMGLTKALARELTPRGIRVNCVAPSMVDTDIAGDLLTPERKVELAKGTLVGRLATVEDIANAILFLASDESAYLTGVTLDVNGGMHMHSRRSPMTAAMPGSSVATRIIAPPSSVPGVGMLCRSRRPKRMPQTGSRLARMLADCAVIWRMLAMKSVWASAVQTTPRMSRMSSSRGVHRGPLAARKRVGSRTTAAVPSW